MSRYTNGIGAMARVLVIGMGNPDRGDDGIGPLVVRRLSGRVPDHVSLLERTGDALALIDDWAGCSAVVLVDASAPRSAPGTVQRIDLRGDELLTDLGLSSTHAFGVADAVGLARALGVLPERVIIYAIEGETFEVGAPISPPVVAASEEVVNRVAAELLQIIAQSAGNSQSQRDATGDATHA
jgi:hydrogenase maturation protease